MLTAISDRNEVREAFNLLHSTFNSSRSVERFERNIRGRGFREQAQVIWHADSGIWALLMESHPMNRQNSFWCCYGFENPKDSSILTPTLEINPPHGGIDMRCGGMFVRDANNNIYLCHTGKIGGGKKGIGKTVFWDRYIGGSIEVDVGRQKLVQVVNLGQINNPKLPSRIARLVHEVKRIKNTSVAASFVLSKFTPEFSGQKRGYSLARTIDATADHGPVVEELMKAVKKAGYEPFNDQQRDLFVIGPNGRMATLFEVKTDVTTTNLYQAVGQLMLNGYAQQSSVRKVLVVPRKPTEKTEQALHKLDIRVLTYNWEGNKPVISSLDGLLS